MKIPVDTIPEDGLQLTEKLNPANISLALDERGINFTNSINIEARIVKSVKEIFIDISLSVPVEYTCARCLAKIHDVFEKKFKVHYEVNPGDILDIDEDIRQEIILGYPVKSICKTDCKGLCPNCGQNLNVDKCEC